MSGHGADKGDGGSSKPTESDPYQIEEDAAPADEDAKGRKVVLAEEKPAMDLQKIASPPTLDEDFMIRASLAVSLRGINVDPTVPPSTLPLSLLCMSCIAAERTTSIYHKDSHVCLCAPCLALIEKEPISVPCEICRDEWIMSMHLPVPQAGACTRCHTAVATTNLHAWADHLCLCSHCVVEVTKDPTQAACLICRQEAIDPSPAYLIEEEKIGEYADEDAKGEKEVVAEEKPTVDLQKEVRAALASIPQLPRAPTTQQSRLDDTGKGKRAAERSPGGTASPAAKREKQHGLLTLDEPFMIRAGGSALLIQGLNQCATAAPPSPRPGAPLCIICKVAEAATSLKRQGTHRCLCARCLELVEAFGHPIPCKVCQDVMEAVPKPT